MFSASEISDVFSDENYTSILNSSAFSPMGSYLFFVNVIDTLMPHHNTESLMAQPINSSDGHKLPDSSFRVKLMLICSLYRAHMLTFFPRSSLRCPGGPGLLRCSAGFLSPDRLLTHVGAITGNATALGGAAVTH